ncbi:hypothetical protein K503DRAFT_815035 [Rhizopogon vinicolor AM-OR11-026]|uniref:Uncharacterized protein n=1 Tax=Rhizopogon vinicolor AM-OR11-026 TaxID=1314800 RepID=A0A1B7MET9_9AGAM|nr:hypothetical protein K503DRAFT_815035 [Rhizopogon vinicolor AM-OR11-026]
MIQRRDMLQRRCADGMSQSIHHDSFLGLEFLVHYLFFNDPSKPRCLTNLFTSNLTLGWWTRHLHIAHFQVHYNSGPPLDEFEAALTSVLLQTPNLERVLNNKHEDVDFDTADVFRGWANGALRNHEYCKLHGRITTVTRLVRNATTSTSGEPVSQASSEQAVNFNSSEEILELHPTTDKIFWRCPRAPTSSNSFHTAF